jgi:membrane protease YdiL (CAAX protease family)
MTFALSARTRLLMGLLAVVAGLIATISTLAALHPTPAGTTTRRCIAVVVGSATIAAFGVFVLRSAAPHLRRVATARRPLLRAILTGVGAGVGALIMMGIILAVGRSIDPEASRALDRETQLQTHTWWQAALIGLALIVLAPIGEELVFRAIVLRSLASWMAWLPAMALSATVFAASHLDVYLFWPRGVALLVAGMILATVYRAHGLVGSMTTHATVNTAAFVALLLS